MQKDGFRPDNFDAKTTPELFKLSKHDGVFMPNIRPEFPAGRLPYLASLLTGQHVDKHEVKFPKGFPSFDLISK